MGGKRERERTESRECGRKKVRMKVRKWTVKQECRKRENKREEFKGAGEK